MFNLVRDMVSNAFLPDALIEPCLDVLRKLSAGQKDFVRIIVELVQEIEDVIPPAMIHDSEDEDEAEIAGHLNGEEPKAPQPSPSPEQAAEQALIDARRLSIMAGMLERIVGAVQEMTAMHGLISQLIVPSVRSKDETVRDRGFKCLGLCCLLDAKMALNTFQLFLQEIGNAEGATRQTLIQILFDQLTTHGIAFLCQPQIREQGGDEEAADIVHGQIVNFLLSLLEDDDAQIQAFAAEGMAKLMLSGIVTDDDALRSLILVYMSPETSDNQQLRQCLSYFLPIYCYSSAANQRRLQRVVVPALDVLTEVYYERDDRQEMVSPLQVGLQLLDWCDPSKGVYANKADVTIHIDVAIEIVQALFVKEQKEDRKVLCQLLGRLIMPDQDTITNGKTDDSPIAYALFILIGTLQKVRPLEDAMSKNNLAKFQLACKRLYPSLWSKLQSMDIQNAPEIEGVRAFVQECGFDPSKKLDKGDDGTIIAELEVRKGNSSSSAAALARRTISATSSRSASGANSRKASTGSVSFSSNAGGQPRKSKVKIESDEEMPTIEQSIMEEDEEEEDEDIDTTAGEIHALAIDNDDDFDTL
jgi:condensin complex subunit 3